MFCVSGSQTFVRLSHMRKIQTSVSHSSAAARIAGLNIEGLPAVHVWDCVVQVLAPANLAAAGDCSLDSDMLNPHSLVGCVPPGIPQSSVHALLYNSEDDEAVLRMINKGRPHLRHVSRTHRINSDWLHERINWYPTISIRTKCFWCPQITAVPCARKERNAPWSHAAVEDSWRTNRFANGWSILVVTSCPG